MSIGSFIRAAFSAHSSDAIALYMRLRYLIKDSVCLSLTVCLAMLWTRHGQSVDAGIRLDVVYVSVDEVHAAAAAEVVGGRRGDGTRLVGPGQVAVGSVGIVDVVERGTALADVDVDAVAGVRLDVDAEPVDAVDSLLQLVGTFLLLRVLQTLSTERAQQQRQEQIQNLRSTNITSP